MRKSNMVIVVPTKESTVDEQTACGEVWAEVTNFLKPGLGQLYSRFYPAARAWGLQIMTPFCVVLGSRAPEYFLRVYMQARQKQSDALTYHIDELLNTLNEDDIQQVGDTFCCHLTLDEKNEAQTAHAIWHVGIQKGVPLPDCGIYYLQLHRAIATRDEERSVLGNPKGYALCVVALEYGDEQDG